MDNVTYNLIISEVIRVVYVWIILYLTKIPLFYKTILIIVSDSFDCRLAKLVLDDWVDLNSSLFSDKITDMISYGMLLYYVLSIRYLPNIQNNIALFLYSFRLIGVVLFIILSDRIILIYFPNFFMEFLLVFITVQYFEISEKYIPYLLFFASLWKISQEYYLHIYKETHPESFLR